MLTAYSTACQDQLVNNLTRNQYIQGFGKLILPYGLPTAGLTPADVVWRVESRRYSVILDAEREIYGTSDPQLEATWYIIAKRTACGVRIEGGKFINMKAHKRWACPTLKEALESCMQRALRARSIHLKRAYTAQVSAAMAFTILDAIEQNVPVYSNRTANGKDIIPEEWINGN